MLIRAAGGVLHRASENGVELALIHRPRFDDWSLPKGKRKRGEHPILNAFREVWEETGVRPRVGARLPSISYQVPNGGRLVDKTVDYWAMAAVRDDGFFPGEETDARVWLPTADAISRLTYERDVGVVRAFAAWPPLRRPIILVRHASAGERRNWTGPDDARPLDAPGATRARLLERVLSCFGPAQLVSAAPQRCLDTLAPLARRLSLTVVVDRAFDETADPCAAAAQVIDLIPRPGDGATVVCSQGKLIPPLLARVAGGTAEEYHTPKGRGWVLCFSDDRSLVTLDPLD